MLRDPFLHSLTDCLKNKILKKFRNYLRPTSDAIYTLKETPCDLGLKRWNEPTVPSEKMVLDLAKSVKEWLRYWRFKTVDGFIHLQKFPFTESEDLPGSGSGGLVEDGLELPYLALALISLCLPENFWFQQKILKNELEDSKTTRWARKWSHPYLLSRCWRCHWGCARALWSAISLSRQY